MVSLTGCPSSKGKKELRPVEFEKNSSQGKNMLVLTRKPEEQITIGNGKKKIIITILKIQGDKVSIGIKADKETPIFRNELIEEELVPVEMS